MDNRSRELIIKGALSGIDIDKILEFSRKERAAKGPCAWCRDFKGIELKGFTLHGVTSTKVLYCPQCGEFLGE